MRCLIMNKNKKDIELMKEAKEEFEVEVGEDTTKYGEFISSYFAWVPLPEQKEKAKEMEKMTKNNKKQRK